MKRLLVLFILVFLGCWMSPAQNHPTPTLDFHSWAATPAMGWNSWDCYGPTVNEQEVKENADYMALHLKKFGWEYIVIDIR